MKYITLNRQRGKGKVKVTPLIMSFVDPEKLHNIPAVEWEKNMLQNLSCKMKERNITYQSYVCVVCLAINLTLTWGQHLTICLHVLSINDHTLSGEKTELQRGIKHNFRYV